MVLFKTLIFLVIIGFSESGCSERAKQSKEIEIFSRKEWYIERSEKEIKLEGILQQSSTGGGPNARIGLDYQLIMEQRTLLVYSANVEMLLGPLMGKKSLLKVKS